MRVYIMVLLVALATTMIATPIIRRFALSMNIVTPLRARDVHAYPIPRLGGIAITGGIVMAMVFGNSVPFLHPIYEQSSVLWAVVVGAMAITVLGLIDDIWELDWLAKLAGQILITGGMAMGGVQLINIPVFGVTIGGRSDRDRLRRVLLLLLPADPPDGCDLVRHRGGRRHRRFSWSVSRFPLVQLPSRLHFHGRQWVHGARVDARLSHHHRHRSGEPGDPERTVSDHPVGSPPPTRSCPTNPAHRPSGHPVL